MCVIEWLYFYLFNDHLLLSTDCVTSHEESFKQLGVQMAATACLYNVCIMSICYFLQIVLPAIKSHPKQLGVQNAATACLYNVCMLQIVLPAMKSHPKQLGVQMAATACLYNLSKGEVGPKVHPACLKLVVNLTLTAMENFPNHQQVNCSKRCCKLFISCTCKVSIMCYPLLWIY